MLRFFANDPSVCSSPCRIRLSALLRADQLCFTEKKANDRHAQPRTAICWAFRFADCGELHLPSSSPDLQLHQPLTILGTRTVRDEELQLSNTLWMPLCSPTTENPELTGNRGKQRSSNALLILLQLPKSVCTFRLETAERGISNDSFGKDGKRSHATEELRWTTAPADEDLH